MMNSWREGRDDDGWKMKNREWKLFSLVEEDLGMEPETRESRRKRKRGARKKGFCRDNIPNFAELSLI